MDCLIKPSQLRGRWLAPQSKSFAHRVMIREALLGHEMPCLYFCDDTAATYDCLKALFGPDEIAIMDCRDSASTLRMLLPLAGAMGRRAYFTGSAQLAGRPIEDLINLMEEHGCRFSSHKLPFEIGGKLNRGNYSIRGDVSSQYISGLLFALEALPESKIEITSPQVSAAYTEITKAVLNGAEMEGDWSAAAFFYAANAMGAEIEIGGLNQNSLQPDSMIKDIDFSNTIELDANIAPDLAPALAAAAHVLGVRFKLKNGERLRLKESDRLYAIGRLCKGLDSGKVDSMGDHRVVMAAAVAACHLYYPVLIKGADCVSKSYPAFFDELIRLGGDIEFLE